MNAWNESSKKACRTRPVSRWFDYWLQPNNKASTSPTSCSSWRKLSNHKASILSIATSSKSLLSRNRLTSLSPSCQLSRLWERRNKRPKTSNYCFKSCSWKYRHWVKSNLRQRNSSGVSSRQSMTSCSINSSRTWSCWVIWMRNWLAKTTSSKSSENCSIRRTSKCKHWVDKCRRCSCGFRS